jgi:hypothetical protein
MREEEKFWKSLKELKRKQKHIDEEIEKLTKNVNRVTDGWGRWVEGSPLPFLLLLAVTLYSVIIVNTSIGWADARFLTFTPGARANSLASAFTAIADDIYAAYHNDAGLGFQNRITFGWYGSWSPHFALFKKESHSFLGAILPMPVVGGSFAISALYYNYDEGFCTDFSYKISYGKRVSKYLSLGIGAKTVGIGGDRDPPCGEIISWALDFSSLYQRANFRTGMAIQNVGPPIQCKYYVQQEDRTDREVEEKVPFPFLIRGGLYDKFLMYEGHEFAIALDVVRSLTNQIDMDLFQICSGTEYIYHNFLSLRLGYRRDINGYESGFTCGMGIIVRDEEKGSATKIDVGIAETEALTSLSTTEFSIAFRM